jgi:hypothetical protein
MNDYDQASRYAAKLHPPGFLRWLLAGRSPLVFREWYDTTNAPLPYGEDRTSDTIALMDNSENPAEPFAVVVEFETENDAEILERELEYLAIIRRRLRRRGFQVVGTLINLTGAEQNDLLEMALPGEADYGLRLRLKIRTLRDEDAAALFDAIAAGTHSRCLLPWIPLMRGGGEAAIIERWKEIAGAEPDARLRSDYGVLAKTFARLKDHADAWHQALKEWNMVESPVWKEIRDQGRAEGWLESQRRNIVRVIERRLQSPVPEDLAAMVQASSDLAELQAWFDAALTAADLEAFRRAVVH